MFVICKGKSNIYSGNYPMVSLKDRYGYYLNDAAKIQKK